MLSAGNSPRTLLVDFLEHVLRQVLTDIRALWLWRERDGRHGVLVRSDELALAFVPCRKELRRGRGADETGVGDPSEAHAGDVARSGVDAVEVPDGLASLGVELTGCKCC